MINFGVQKGCVNMYDSNSMYILADCYSGSYDWQVICLSYDSIYSYIQLIQDELKFQNVNKAKVVFDQLLITGNSTNRFLSIEFHENMFLFDTAKNIIPELSIKQKTHSILAQNIKLLDNCVLTKKQVDMIKKGLVL